MVRSPRSRSSCILRAKGYEDNRFTIIPNQDKRFDKALVAR
jgi:hypothetical protein